jgi:hypothetical protein
VEANYPSTALRSRSCALPLSPSSLYANPRSLLIPFLCMNHQSAADFGRPLQPSSAGALRLLAVKPCKSHLTKDRGPAAALRSWIADAVGQSASTSRLGTPYMAKEVGKSSRLIVKNASGLSFFPVRFSQGAHRELESFLLGKNCYRTPLFFGLC